MQSEISTYCDRTSGVVVTQLTNYRGHSHHFYFTNPGWYAGGRKLLFASDRCNRTNLFGLDLESGEIEQLTDLAPVPLPRELEFVRACKNPLREEAYFWHDLDLMAVDLNTKISRLMTQIDPRWCVSQTNCSADGRFIYFGVWEDLSNRFEVDLLRGYIGFAETWAAKPLSQVLRVPVGGGPAEVVFEERYWIGHVNTSPTQPDLLTICHEGPWDKVDNRIWGLDAGTARVWEIRPTVPGEIVGHEDWYADGMRIGYHGHLAGGRRILGRANWDGSGVYEADFPGETGHIFSNAENLIVGDGAGAIRVWQWDGAGYRGPRLLCRHDSAMQIQQTHPHPRISPDGASVIFTSDRSGYGNVYRVQLPDFETLPEISE
jgi:oligogalacturonide lyase